ncbi:Sensory box histidine kinase [Minicystis rosea]|nr:Sensory box histidine kinase [Minicystis rosea]
MRMPELVSGPEQDGHLYKVQKALLQQIAGGASLRQMLVDLTSAMEKQAPGLLASILLVEDRRLLHGAAPSLPDAYNLAVDSVPIGEGLGSCGTAAHRRELVIVADTQSDPLWKDYRDIARRYELGACWSMPIFGASGAVLGTFALYHRSARQPRPSELRLVQEFAELAAIAIDHDRMKEGCRESERSFRALADDVDAITWEADAETGRFTYVSKRAEEMLGYPVKRWSEDAAFWSNIIHPEDREATLRRFAMAKPGTSEREWECRVIAADGRVVWLRGIVHSKTNVQSRAPRLRGVMVNISRQREAEQERDELLQRLLQEQSIIRAVIERMPGGVVVAAPSGRILMVNDQAARLWRRPAIMAEGIEHDAAWHGFHPDGRPYRLEDLPLSRAIVQGESVDDEEIDFQLGDGTRATLAVSAAPVHDAEGNIVAGVGVFSDITARKQADADFRFLADAGAALVSSLDAEATVRSLATLAVRDLADWCAIVVRDGGRVRCVAFAHRDPEKAGLAAEIDRLLPQPGGAPFGLSEVLATGRSQLFSQISRKAFEPGASRPELLRLMRTLGAESAIDVAMQVRERVIGAIIYGSAHAERRYGPHDLTVAEELARRAALALESARLYADARAAIHQRDEFLAIAAHELKTPLACLQLALQTILRQLDKPTFDVEPLRERARASERQGSRLARLVDELLDVSIIQAGRMRLERETMDLAAAVTLVVSRFKEELSAKGIDFVVHAPAPVIGRWDRLRVEQVITNVVSNAIKYGKGRPVRVTVEADGAVASVSFMDQGQGMSPELIQRLFMPFERGVAAGHYGGLGLGLYITAQIVRAHGGAVRIQSAVGEGSTVTIELPREASA